MEMVPWFLLFLLLVLLVAVVTTLRPRIRPRHGARRRLIGVALLLVGVGGLLVGQWAALRADPEFDVTAGMEHPVSRVVGL